MRRTVLFISRLALGFLILSVCCFGFFVVSTAPVLIQADSPTVSLGRSWETPVAIISGNKISCAEEDRKDFFPCQVMVEGSCVEKDRKDVFQCQVMVEERPLEMTVTYDGYCRATYAGKVMNCLAGVARKKPLTPSITIEDNLGLSDWQLQALKLANPVANYGSETFLIRLAKVISLAAAVFTTTGIWLLDAAGRLDHQVMKVFLGLGSGVIVLIVSFFFLVFSLLPLGFFS